MLTQAIAAIFITVEAKTELFWTIAKKNNEYIF